MTGERAERATAEIDRARAVALLGSDPARTCVLSDFDGTLAPIVTDPSTSSALPGAVEVLHRLAASFAVVAVVSGRPASFLASALRIGSGASRLEAYGLYGAEHVDASGRVTTDLGARRWAPAIADAATELEAHLPARVAVELKQLGVTVHWRSAPELAAEVGTLALATARRHGLEVRGGKMSVELLPPGALDKGAIVRRLAANASAACFIGDDSGDLAAFRALAMLGSTAVVRLAVKSEESPAELLDEADVVLDGPNSALAFLEALADTTGAGAP